MNVHAARHVVVIAADPVSTPDLASALALRAEAGSTRITVVCPVTAPAAGLVVYEDSRRDAARTRLEFVLATVRTVDRSARGCVVDAGLEDAARDACAQHAPDELIVCARAQRRRPGARELAQRLERATHVPVEVIAASRTKGVPSVLAVTSGGLPRAALLARIRVRSRLAPARFTIVCPGESHDARALRHSVEALRFAGIDACGHLGHPDPRVAALTAVADGCVEEIIVSLDARARRRGRALPHRLADATGLPVESVYEDAA